MRRLSAVVLLALFSVVFGIAACGAARNSDWVAARLVNIRPDSIQVREQGGTLVTASLTPSSILLSQGMPTLSLKAFPPGATVMLRLRPATKEGGLPRVEVLSDTRTSDALAACAGHLSGSITAALPGWVVVKTDDFSTVPIELTSSTLYRRLGDVTSSCPFSVGDYVSIATRQSVMGILLAASVTDEESANLPGTTLPFSPASTVKGTIYVVQAASHGIIVLTGQNAQVAISAPSNITSIRIARRKGTLADLHAGMKVVVHLTGGSDPAGYVAKSISASQ